MKNCLITGFGRSGTSLMAGLLHSNGYFLGNNLYTPRFSNPKGFFENDFINGINESILESYDYNKVPVEFRKFKEKHSPFNPDYGHRWLSFIEEKTKIECNNQNIIEKIKKATKNINFAYKDPRFNYTLGVWSNFITNDTLIICVFRNPSVVFDSVLKECKNADYLSNFYINPEIIEKLWYNSYSYILNHFYKKISNQIYFINYEQLINHDAKELLNKLLETNLDFSFADNSLNRSIAKFDISANSVCLYKELCKLANFQNA